MPTNGNRWNVSKVTSIGVMFSGTPFNYDINSWNTSNLIVADHVFYNAGNFNQSLSNWNMSKVTIYAMFSNATSFNKDISGWNVSKVTNFGYYGIHANNHSDSLFKNSSSSYFWIKEDLSLIQN